MVGAQNLATGRKSEILRELTEIKKEKSLDFIFLSLIDLEDSYNIFVVNDSDTQNLFGKIFNLDFKSNFAQKCGLIMRKEIVPLIKESLEIK